LQEAFRRHLGTTPMSYLQELRLACAHDALVRADPTAVTVSQVALRCGFAHPGRFSLAYRANYGIPPSETLRHSRIRSLAA
jgi:transcriptional regulator GlxA family with amidase domain